MKPVRISLLAAALGVVFGAVLAPPITVAGDASNGWGTLRGRIVLTGAAPELKAIDASGDEFCCEAEPKNQSLLLGADQGIANVVVYLRSPLDAEQVHPQFAATPASPVELDNQGCTFKPHVALVRTGQPFVLKNTDPTNHNIKGDLDDEAFNILVPAGGEQTFSFSEPQRLPRQVGCNIHPFMQGWLLVRDNPYMTLSADNGTFELRNLPAGTYEFQFWHELPGYLGNVGSTTAKLDRRGRVTLTIPNGGTLDVGTIEVAASELTP